MNSSPDELEQLRRKLATLEQRESDLTKRIDKLVGKLDSFDPELNALMREGLPLDLFTRASLLTANYEVHGYHPYYLNNTDSTRTERSIDIYASTESVYTVPEGKGRLSGQSWPVRDNLLVECKQRREGVRWLFCNLPTSKTEWSVAGKDVPVTNAGFELRPTADGYQSSGNPKDVKNAIAQLNEAYIPFLVSREPPSTEQRQSHLASPRKEESTWLLLVTNATLKVFSEPTSFDELLKAESSTSKHFTEVPWLVFKPDRSLALMQHQQLALTQMPLIAEKEISLPYVMSDSTHEVHIVNFKQLPAFLELVRNPPRIESIRFNIQVDGVQTSSFEIR